MHGGERLTRVLVRGDGADLELGVVREQPQQLAPRVSARTRDGDGDGHGFNLRVRRDGTDAATSRERLNGSATRRRRDSAHAADTTERDAP